METITENEIETIYDRNGYKYVALYDQQLRPIVAITNKANPKEKIKEIRKRLATQKDGIYIIRYQYNLGKRYPYFDFAIQKGAAAAPGTPQQPIIIQAPPPAPLSEAQEVRTWEEALRDKQELAELRAKLATMEAQDQEPEEPADEKPALMEGLKGLAESVIPQFLPVFDRWMTYKERALSLEEQRANRTPSNLRPVHPFRPVPSPGSENWEAYLTYLEKLPDIKYVEECQYLEATAPDIYQEVLNVFTPDQDNTAAQ